MIVRHYNRHQQRGRHVNPDAELDARLKIADTLVVEPRSNLTGIGVVTPPAKVKATRPRRVRRNQGYIARNGAWIATEPAPYLEFDKDVSRRFKIRRVHEPVTKVTVAQVGHAQSYAARLDLYGPVGNNADA